MADRTLGGGTDYEQALAAIKAHQEILSMVAHDLRSPLGVISLWAQQLLQEESSNPLGQSARLGLSSIARNAQRMERLIADLLDESRLRTGRLPLECGEHLLSDLLADATELAVSAPTRRIHISVVPPTSTRRLCCDRGRVVQALENLLANAVRFSPTGGTVTVSVHDDEAGAIFAVHDDGIGIAADHLPRIFDRFWQGKKGDHAGVGLGLYIVRGIVESHGGRVWVESESGNGSTFYFFLPDARDGSPQAVDAAASTTDYSDEGAARYPVT